jgi:acyl-CoA synthetase (AMP-forming)/AMP-acid ligase II
MNPALADEDYDAIETLAGVARRHGRVRGEKIALSFEGRDTSYAELDRRSNQAANALIAAGVQPGDAIAYFGKNSDHYFELLLAAGKARAIMAPVGWRLSATEAGYIIADAQAKLVFVGPECVETLKAAAPEGVAIVAMEEGAHDCPVYEAWRGAQPATDPARGDVADDVVLLLYTSGTTGKPKGVMLTSANLLRARTQRVELGWNEWFDTDVNYVAMPVAHIGGTGWGFSGLFYGVKNIVARDFNPLEALEVIEREGVGKMFMVPAALQFVIRMPRAREIDYSKLRLILYGASPMPVALLRECMDVFGCKFCQQYGMTETTGTIVYLPPEDHDPKGAHRMAAAGLPMPGVELRIVDAEGSVLGANQTGEIATRSPANMAGYWRNESATASTLANDGWLRTGDAGHIDEDGYLFIQDRIKDMICSGAENIYPAEVENAIHGHADVAEVAVIGVPDETWGEAVKAIVVLKPGVAGDPADIIAFAREHIATYKAPKSVDFRDQPLPRSASGKILRRELREPYWAGKERRVN